MTTSKIKTQDFLSVLPLFNQLAPVDLDNIARATTEMKVDRGEMVFHRGDPCVGFHTIVYGRVKLAFVSQQGSDKVVEIIGPGHSFGEALMFMEKPYIVSAQALADSLLLHVGKSAVFAGIERDPQFARKMLAGLARRIHALVLDVEAYSLNSGTQRVIGYLLKGEELADGDCVRLEVSKTIIASRLNLTPEHFSRILHDLSSNQLIAVNGREVTMLDIRRLRDYQG
jgi:CRP-like cAMP-binding protein